MKRMIWTLAGSLLVMPLAVLAQSGPNYTEGAITEIAAIKVNAGHFDEYMAYLGSTWTKEQAALKAAGIITDYRIYGANPRHPDEADIYLATTYANMAALDGLSERSDPVIAKALGSNREKDMKNMADRNAYREVLGVERVRELQHQVTQAAGRALVRPAVRRGARTGRRRRHPRNRAVA